MLPQISLPPSEPPPEPVKEEPKPTPEPEPYKRTGRAGWGEWPKTRGIEPIPKIQTEFTLPEFQQKIFGIYTKGQLAYSETFKEEWKKGIIPTERYRVPMIGGRHVSQQELDVYLAGKPPGWIPQYQIFTGAELITRRETELETWRKGVEPQLAETWKHFKELEKMPPETKIIRKDGEYEFIFPDLSLEWSKGEFRKIEKAYKIHPLLGATAEFGFGAVSTFAALGKPLAQLFADKPLPHYVSPLDVAFEPLGWAPKGSVELLGKHPVAMAGGIWGETLQMYAMGQALKPVTKGVSIGVKGVMKRAPIVYTKLGRPFPTVVSKFGEVSIAKTFYQWGAKGFQKGLRLAPGGAKVSVFEKPSAKIITQELRIGGRGAVEKIWLSPAEYVKAQKAILAKLAQKPYISIAFPKVGEPMSIVKYGRWKLVGKQLIQPRTITYGYGPTVGYGFEKPLPLAGARYTGFARKLLRTTIRDIRVGKGITFLKPYKARYPIAQLEGGVGTLFETKIVHPAIVLRGTRPTKIAAFSELFRKGYHAKKIAVVQFMKSSGEYSFGEYSAKSIGIKGIGFVKGAGKTPLEMWHKPIIKEALKWRLRHPIYFWKTEAAAQQLIPTVSVEHLTAKIKPSAAFAPGKLGIIQKLKAPVFSVSMVKKPYYFMAFGYTTLKPIQMLEYRKEVIPVSKREELFAPVSSLAPKFDRIQIQLQALAPVTKPIQFQKQLQAQLQGQLQLTTLAFPSEQMYKPVFMPPIKVIKPPTKFAGPSPILPAFFIPKVKLAGRGRRYYDEELFGKKYRFRKGKIWNPLKDLGFSKKKSTKRKRKRR